MSNIIKKYSLVIIYSLVLIFGIIKTFTRNDIDDYRQLVYFVCIILMFFALMLLWHSTNIGTNKHFIKLVSIECFAIGCVIFYFIFKESYLISYIIFTCGYIAFLLLTSEFHYYQNYLLGNIKYYKQINIAINTFVFIFCFLFVVNYYYPIFFGWVDGEIIFYSNAIILTVFSYILSFLFFIRVFMSNKSMREKFVLISFIIFPVLIDIVTIIFSPIYKMNDLEIISMRVAELISLYLIYFNIHVDERRKNMEMKQALITSQVGPHFLYNSLATISSIAENEGSLEASDAINKFADYLRMNIDSIKNNRLISFEKELEHIETYLWLEHKRFGEDLNVVYDIQVKDFMLPPLTIQPLVENAVNHGVLKKKNGGTVKITTETINNKIIITVEDDGVGFIYDENEHFGIYNIKERIKSICDGQVIIDSQINKGTKARVIL